ncbi:MAG: mannose-1-phosphate guanylyltransferase [Chitinispirillaceae bacterium]|nr:mannose-1-phosphate guanylyltransferase [Chitinispirillaceae bacterium]
MSTIVPVILAGGIGERFWPLSRSSHPKQLLALASGKTLIEETLSRAREVGTKGVIPLVITGSRIASRINALLSGTRSCDCIVEPVGKNTAPAVALAAAWIEARYGTAIMVVLPADHLVRPLRDFKAAVRCACDFAAKFDQLVVFGITPTRPDTGYGYIQLGAHIGGKGAVKCFRVARFVEKPDAKTAQRYCAAGTYRWNSGMFVWKTRVLLEEVRTHMPLLFNRVAEASKKRFSTAAIDAFYKGAVKESVDYGIMERSQRVSAVSGNFFWDDIGSWESLSRIHPPARDGTTVVGERVFQEECTSSLIVNRSSHALAAIGCSNLAVVATHDAVLVIDRSKLPDIKEYLGRMKKRRVFPQDLF